MTVHDRHSSFAILGDTLFEEIRLVLETQHCYPVERIYRPVENIYAELTKETIRDILDVLTHVIRIHSNQSDRNRRGDKFNLEVNSTGNDFVNG